MSLSFFSANLHPDAEMAGVANRGIPLPLCHPFYSILSALQRVTGGHQVHNPSWDFDRIPSDLLEEDNRSLRAFNTMEEPHST